MEPIKQRYSHQRETILSVVQSTLVHPTADWVYKETRKIIPNISLGTVYRNLNQLVESGRLLKLKDEAMVRYDGNTGQHDHFSCSVCGKWYDIELLDPSIFKSFAEKYDFKIESINLELEGTCKDCLDS
ncbi:MAG: transcriptional repressor [Candidatus Marinimicrobia bacterium]|nr:transcriptional repressor [Candidatus Neomarinimicrobiota bacterium]